MDKPQDPRPDNVKNVVKSRRISFSDDLRATSINPVAYSPMRRLSAHPMKMNAEPENQALQKTNHYKSTQKESNFDLKSYGKCPSLYGGGFESILSQVSDTYKIQDILPKQSNTSYLKSEFSISSLAVDPTLQDPALIRQPTDKSVDSRRKIIQDRNISLVNIESSNSEVPLRRKSLRVKNNEEQEITNDRGNLWLIMADDQVEETKREAFVKTKIESESTRGLQKLMSFNNRSVPKIIQAESDDESIKSFESHHSDDDHHDFLVESFTGELLKRKSTFMGATKSPEINFIPIASEASTSIASNHLNISLQDNVKRRGSFASSLFNVPAPNEEIKQPQSTKPRLKLKPALHENQQIIPKDNINRLLNVQADHSAPLPKIKESKQNDTKNTNTIEIWKKLREDSKGFQQNEPVDPSKLKFVGMDEVATVVQDLKKLGMNPNIINEVDKTTLKSVIGVKKWVASSKQKKATENPALRKFIKTVDHRLMNELPKSLNTDLVTAILPILHSLKKEYRLQLGDSHEYVERLDSYIQSVNIQSDYKKRHSIFVRENDTFFGRIMKIFQSPEGRVSPLKMTPARQSEYDDEDDSIQDDDYEDCDLLPITARRNDDS